MSSVSKLSVLPFSPLSRDEEAIVDAYLARRTSSRLNGYLRRVLRELGVSGQEDTKIGELDIGAGLIAAKYAGGEVLPDFGGYEDDQFRYTRAMDKAARRSRRLLSPVLLSVIWASGPSADWPSQYRVTWMPRQGRWIVTSSQDADEGYGFTDFAIGHFEGSPFEIIEKAKPLILEHWRSLRDDMEQERWEMLDSPGMVVEEVAHEWRDAVWCDPEEEFEEDVEPSEHGTSPSLQSQDCDSP